MTPCVYNVSEYVTDKIHKRALTRFKPQCSKQNFHFSLSLSLSLSLLIVGVYQILCTPRTSSYLVLLLLEFGSFTCAKSWVSRGVFIC
ncbi:hypothetical protein RJT34_00374 [Clitoria ternatea]|uniref:Uncharacterized protein n=1 Tax=Clitoria ternatea TaxID=43366 RepID=A0AAN9KH24_CLITE